ncbi:MAG: hypothetical protein J7604_16450 [Sporocytophaga sp.]|uniref:hypothetical protein n=1 Tax=Sporocytophaga sp. TaxID=2231183 RepID=UPI001B0E4051|nr:hypothetical protein [Sporocytophaga sp.]MBO9701799.1 hypothetical protein [Sporocytophaga sp.]
MREIIKFNYKILLTTSGLFIIGVALAIMFEDYYRRLIRYLFILFNGENIQFTGKNFHLFPSELFVVVSGLFISLTFFILYITPRINISKIIICTVLIFFLTTFIITLIDSERLIAECTACRDGIRNLMYNEVPYDRYYLLSIILSLCFLTGSLTLKFVEKKEAKDELLGIWTREDDGSGLLAIFGWSLNFKDNDAGEYNFWEGTIKENHGFHFLWQRISEDSIRIKQADSETWDVIQYRIEKTTGAYRSKQLKLTEKNKDDFWDMSEPLFKSL